MLTWCRHTPTPELSRKIAEELGVHSCTAQVILNRNIRSIQEAQAFLDVDLMGESNFEMPLLERATQCLEGHIKKKSRIMLFGDYDADGVTSTALLYRFLSTICADVVVHIPHRFHEGYGFKTSHVALVKDQKIDLLILLDCGITSTEAVGKLGEDVDVIICDHHTIPETPPKAEAILNPRALPDSHACYGLCTVGIVYKWLSYVVKYLKRDYALDEDLDLVAIGTVADVMVLQGENRRLVSKGLAVLNQRRHLGLNELLKAAAFNKPTINEQDIGFVIGPRLNAAGRLATAMYSYSLLVSKDEKERRAIAGKLEVLNQDRRQIGQDILKEAQEMIEASEEASSASVLVLCKKGWHAGVIGIAAAHLARQYEKPVVLMASDGELVRASARSIAKINIYEMLYLCESFFLNFGGHKQAAGFSMLPEKVDSFIQEFRHETGLSITEEDRKITVSVDEVLNPNMVNLKFAEELKRLAPFGQGNPEPVFYANTWKVVDVKAVGNGTHIKATFTDAEERVVIDGIGFGLADKMDRLYQPQFEILFHLDINSWQGRTLPQLKLIDIR